MADNSRNYPRDLKTGKFAKVDLERDVIAPGLGVPKAYACGLEQRHAPDADDLAQGGQPSPLRPRGALLVPDDGEARTMYGIQGALGRDAARRHAGPMDPSSYLTGADDGR